ncbi:MAG: efflux RND transporter periplasmic adaptor subunit [Bacteroides sp.]
MMKKLYTMMAAVALLAACTGEKKSDVAQDPAATTLQPVADNGADSASTAVTEEVDGVTAATNVANRPTFNGLLMVSPQQQATLSLTMGGKVNSLHVMPGQAIGYGQVVATIDNPEYIELQLDYLDAAAQLEYLEKEYSRQRTLGDQDAASQKKVQQSKAEYLSMKARFEAAGSRLKALGVDTQLLATQGIKSYLEVKAPLSGYVTNLRVNLGTYLNAGEPICDLINKSQLLLQLTVYEKDLSLMQVGGEVEFRVNGMGKETFKATVVAIDQSVDATDYSIKVYARVLSNCPDFRPGMYVRARIKN